ncbi:hypothetical protein QBC36DRAFT_348874 [Triangularia setosa]|uniref:Uncharacterized protein n=1 Tax=Triangularia setosa TaxID=2587417 RepID=A0AAN6W0S7_9PEZI|nr:hypothetical protein QBC36DRAFT_348874 [Podospora setosa]
MPNEPISPRAIRLSQKLRTLSRFRSRGIEDKGEAEQFRMVHTPDRPHRIITPVEAPSEEECGDTISSWHKAVKGNSDDEEGEAPKLPGSYWKTPDYTGGHPGQFQPQHHDPHMRGHSYIYTLSGLSQEIHVDSFQDRSRGVRRSVSEHNSRTYLESPVLRPLVLDKSKQRQKHLHHTPSPLVKQSMERDISRGKGREKDDQSKSGEAATYSLPRDYRIKAMESPHRGQCPYCRCQLGNRTHLTCPNPPCGKGLTTFEGSWVAPPTLKDRRAAPPSIFGAIGRQLLGRPLKSSPDKLPPPPPTSTSRQAQRVQSSSPATTTWSQFAQGQGNQAPYRLVAGFERERKKLPPPVHIQHHPRFEHINTSYLRDYFSGSSSGASTPTPSHSLSPAPPLRSAPPQIALALRPAPPSQPLGTPASLNNLQPTSRKQLLVSKFSTGQLHPTQQTQGRHSPQQYPGSHIASALASSLPSAQPTQPKTTDYLDWCPPSERSLFYPDSAYTFPPAFPRKSSRRRSQSQHAYPPPQPQPQTAPHLQSHFRQQQQQQPSDNPPSSKSDSQCSDYLADDATKAPSSGGTNLPKQKSWTSSKYSTDTTRVEKEATCGDDDGGDDDDDDDDKWNRLDEDHVDTPTQLRPMAPFERGGLDGGGYKSRAEDKGLRVATGKEDITTTTTGREGSKDRLARELEMKRMKWL